MKSRTDMKIKVTMKNPDTMYDALQDAIEAEVKLLDLPDDETNGLVELRIEKERLKMAKWFKYGEYLAVEFDTETMTATVLDA